MAMRSSALRHLVTLAIPGPAVPDGDGGYTQSDQALSPAQMWASITPATTRSLERVAAGTVIATATHIVRMRYHAGVTIQTRITFGTRTFRVTGVFNPDERNVESVLTVAEVVT